MAQNPNRPPSLTDRVSLLRNRNRSQDPAGLFLQEAARDDLKDRLELVNRSFTRIAIVTGFPKLWKETFPTATIVPDEDTLNLSQNSHDLIIHALNLHWSNDPVGQLIQCRQALEPDGLFLMSSFGGRTLQELRAVLAKAETRLCGGLSPRVAPMADMHDLGELLQRAGFALPVADTQSYAISYQNMTHLMQDLRAMGETNALSARRKAFTSRAIFDLASQLYAEAYPDSDTLSATFEIIFLTGWAPAPTQRKPLRPGSATERLAKALNTHETPLKR